MASLSKMTSSAFGVTSMNAIANTYVGKSNDVCLFGGDVDRAKGKKQQGWLGAAQVAMRMPIYWKRAEESD